MRVDQVVKAIESRVTYTLERLEEDTAPEDNFEERDDAAWVRNELRNGNEWAWFVAKVTASVEGFEASDCLGGCSYRDEADFMSGAYYSDMKHEALHALAVRIMESIEALSALGFEVTHGGD